MAHLKDKEATLFQQKDIDKVKKERHNIYFQNIKHKLALNLQLTFQ
jgi:hypothetical protein